MNCTCMFSLGDKNHVICLTTRHFILRLLAWMMDYNCSRVDLSLFPLTRHFLFVDHIQSVEVRCELAQVLQ
jgi:hypothetical protein